MSLTGRGERSPNISDCWMEKIRVFVPVIVGIFFSHFEYFLVSAQLVPCE